METFGNPIWYLKKSKKHFDNFISFIINHYFYDITLWMNYMLFINDFRRNKVKWIFHASDFLSLFMMSFKYDLVSSRYSLGFTGRVYFYHHYFHIRYNPCHKDYPYFLVSNTLTLAQNIFLISLIILFLIASRTFTSLKTFFIFVTILSSDCFCISSFVGIFTSPCPFVTGVD